MNDSVKIKNSTLSLMKADVTTVDMDSFVFYAQNDLSLGSGYGTAIALRGGPAIRKELQNLGPLEVTEATVTSAGNLKARYIIHAVGPKFQEEGSEQKLKLTINNFLRRAEEKGIKSIALPPMGTGFYGVPLDVSARVTIETIAEYLKNGTEIQDVVICAMDTREYKPFEEQLKTLKN
jgi:O-acetyl-ADP-ribose deacetylase (regulator of RNase III)